MPVYIYIVYTTTVLDYLPVGETAQLQEIVYDGSRLCVSRALYNLGIWIPPPPLPSPTTGFQIPCQWNLDSGFLKLKF